MNSVIIKLFKFICILVCMYPLSLSFYLPIIGDDFQLLYSKSLTRINYGDDFTFGNLFDRSLSRTAGWYFYYNRLNKLFYMYI